MSDAPRTPEHECGADAAAYALGALEPAEAERFRVHLATCGICRDEVAAFSSAVNALPLSAHQYEAPPELRQRVMSVVAEDVRALQAATQQAPVRRRPRFGALLGAIPRPALALAGTVIALAAGLVGGLAINSGGSSTRVVSAAVGQAQVRVTGTRGELVIQHLPALAPGHVYEIWYLKKGAKAPTPSTLFGVTKAGTAQIGLVGSLKGISDVLVSAEPAGGSPAPTTTPVVDAKLA
jgi:anti-sigma-K factor RskA